MVLTAQLYPGVWISVRKDVPSAPSLQLKVTQSQNGARLFLIWHRGSHGAV